MGASRDIRGQSPYVSRRIGQVAKEAKQAVLAALAASAANDLLPLRSLYGSVATPHSTELFHRVSAQTVEGVQSIIARQNIKWVQDAERLWYDVAGEAITSWNHGLESQDAIIRRAVRRMSEGGLQFVEYKSGVKTSIDAATRRHIISQVGQASGRITMGYMEEFGHDLVFTSAHFGARPEHEVWQGKAYSLSGLKTVGGVTYPNFYRATEYGEVAGLLGVNCRHSYGPYYPGITELPTVPEKMDGMTSEERYRQVQKQRGIEREIRDKKRDIYNAELAGSDVTQFRLELGKQQSRLKAHTEKYSLLREPRREKAYGITKQPRALRGTLTSAIKLPTNIAATVKQATMKNLHSSLINAQMKDFDALFVKYETMAKALNGNLIISAGKIQAIAQAGADFVAGKFTLKFSEEVFSSKTAYMNQVWQGVRSKHFMPATKGEAVKYASRHEFGHLVDCVI